ncbi:MAG: 1,4-alpha-glucan branching protein GlgB [Verrucomicrobiota bacterium]
MTNPSAPLSPDTQAQIDAIVGAYHENPFGFLGRHPAANGGSELRVFRPEAREVHVHFGETVVPAEKRHENGFFLAAIPPEVPEQLYEIEIVPFEGDSFRYADPYQFGNILGEQDVFYLGEGSHERLYEKLGAHPANFGGVEGMTFAVWAPNARRVSIVGDFNRWDGRTFPMRKRVEAGVWEIFLPRAGFDVHYKFEILGADGCLSLKTDPFAFFAQNGPQTASITWNLKAYPWNDAEWMDTRSSRNWYQTPVSIYEVHLGSWQRTEDDRPLSYREAAERLVDHVDKMGFTHIELLPITEYPFDGSWGYQVTGFFAPTSRFGNPDDFRYLVDRCHQRGIGVLLDWVPAHFPKDAHGLGRFDGTNLYEHADPRQGEHQDWGTLIFNFDRNEVRNFLISSALFWLNEYHIDGLRVDAVASMLYLDYSREEGGWVPNVHGGRENLGAIEFLKQLNHVCYTNHPGIMMIAEESTAWGGVSRPVDSGGLGFGFKWNMGWMNDTLDYMSRDPIHRRHHHGEATFSMLYAYDENFMLVLSHDEVVHGKRSLLQKMPGDDWQKFANLRLLYAWMYAHPGKKLLFMGSEMAPWDEWNHSQSLDWHLLMGEKHEGIRKLVEDLNALYRRLPALHTLDHDPHGFDWLEVSDSDNSTFAFLRQDGCGHEVVVAINATPVPREGYRLGVPAPGPYREVFNSDAAIYGGSNQGNAGGLHSEDFGSHGRPCSLVMTLPPLAVVIFERQ